MIKCVIFDLDGVLVDSKELHFESLNLALSEIDVRYVISKEDHINKFDGLPTNKKLEILSKDRQLPVDLYNKIWLRKQEITTTLIKNNTKESEDLIELFSYLKLKNIIIYVASNAIRNTVKLYLLKLNLMEYVDGFLSNEDVKKSKPNPEIYLKIMSKESVSPKETLIVEDSFVGVTAAFNSCANVCIVKDSKSLNKKLIQSYIENNNKKIIPKWNNKNMNILIPMAGAGSRFKQAGYTFPKPLIDVNNKPMIQVVIDNLNIDANYIFIVQKEHYILYNLKYLLNIIAPNCSIIQVDGLTEGAACTTLLAKDIIDNNNPLIIANSDQFIEWDSSQFMYSMTSGNLDGGIVTFESTHPKWSYVKINDENNIIDIKEKIVISNNASVGIYYWTKGSDYVKFAEQMIDKNIRVNNEFYVAPVYKEAIDEGKKIKNYTIDKMWGLGTPEDLQYYLNFYNEKK
jgi:HAD superfamily hydrolase (TIGR01509 family)